MEASTTCRVALARGVVIEGSHQPNYRLAARDGSSVAGKSTLIGAGGSLVIAANGTPSGALAPKTYGLFQGQPGRKVLPCFAEAGPMALVEKIEP